MAVPSNTFQTYQAVGLREDLSKIITNIAPVDTMFFKSIGEADKKPTNTKHEFQTDTLAAAASNAQVEGDDIAATAVVPTIRLFNNQQIQTEVFQISETQESIGGAGREGGEIAYQTAKAMKQLAKDIEYAFLREVRQDGAAATARKMRGAMNWLISNLDKAADATLNADGTVTGGTARPLIEGLVKGALKNVFAAGGNPDRIFAGPFQKQQISGFAGGGNYRTLVEKQKLQASVDVYVSDFGALEVLPHRGMPTDAIFICDMDTWKKSTLRPTQRVELGKTGDSRKFKIAVEHTLEARAENGNGRVASLTTS